MVRAVPDDRAGDRRAGHRDGGARPRGEAQRGRQSTDGGAFDLRSIPTLLVLRGGREVDRLVGVQPKYEIARRLEKVMG
jgi:hypothetical protein